MCSIILSFLIKTVYNHGYDILYSASLSFSVEMCALERLEYKKYITKSNRMKLRLYEEIMLQMVDGRHSFLMKTQSKVSITRILT